jgi:alanine dehydrogenase
VSRKKIGEISLFSNISDGHDQKTLLSSYKEFKESLMRIGIPRERKTLEKRVAVTPEGARQLVASGHTVLIESGAGAGSSFSDDDYKSAGCHIASTLAEVWTKAELLVKVKEPDQSEFQFFRPDLILFDYLHLASLPEVAKALLAAKVTAFAYETLRTSDGRLPLLEPMSEVAGKLSILNGSYYLLSQNGGRGVLLGGAGRAPAAHVVIIGAGIAGHAACFTAAGMGAKVSVLDINQSKLASLKSEFGDKINTIHSSDESLKESCRSADLLIGAVLVPGAATPRVITREMIRSMPKGSVFIDISIDQGGCAETSRPTNLDAPVYEVDGVIHYGVCNMPAQTPRTSTIALASATLPYILKLANEGAAKACESQEMKAALTCLDGRLTNDLTAQALSVK